MPVDSTSYYLAETLGGVSALFFAEFNGIAENTALGEVITITTGDLDGNAAIIVTYTTEDGENTSYFTALGTPASSVIPLSIMAAQPGWSIALVGTWFDEGGEDLAFFLAIFEEMLTTGHAALVTALTGATITDLHVTGNDTFDGSVKTFQGSYTATAGDDVVDIRVRIVLWTSSVPPDEFGDTQILAYMGAPGAGGVTMVGSIAPDLSKIADALDVISLNDIEVSINHGAAMWSVNGKVRVG